MIYVIILIGIVLAGGLILLVRANINQPAPPQKEQREVSAECCGEHEICESESLLAFTEEIVYFNDEELDEYKGLMPEDYTDLQIEEFRDVLLTLYADEVAGWLKSLQLRGINPPVAIREEALMIVTEFRQMRTKK
jgi:hypothetical protein